MDAYSVWVDECPYILPTVYGVFLEGIRDDFAIPCLDNQLIYSATFDDHLHPAHWKSAKSPRKVWYQNKGIEVSTIQERNILLWKIFSK